MTVKNVQTTPTRTYCKRNRPLPYCNQNCRTPWHWKFTQDHRTTRPPPICARLFTILTYTQYWAYYIPKICKDRRQYPSYSGPTGTMVKHVFFSIIMTLPDLDNLSMTYLQYELLQQWLPAPSCFDYCGYADWLHYLTLTLHHCLEMAHHLEVLWL